MKIGIVALSFGKPSSRARYDFVNAHLSTYAAVAHEIVTNKKLLGQDGDARYSDNVQTVVVAQQEIAHFLSELHGDEINIRVVTDAHATHKKSGRVYLDTQDVLNEAFRQFASEGVHEVIVIAHPFIHAWAARRLVKKAGFIEHQFRIDAPIGFDSSQDNLQWWCRGRLRFLAYLAIQAAGKAIGKDFHGIGEQYDPPRI
jgi:hypothetical protein